MLPLIETWLINATIGQSVVRNQGAGIVNGIRYELYKHFSYKEFFNALQDKRGPGVYAHLLDALTKKLENKAARDENDQPGQDQIKWGSARKCINLVARSAVYNIYICRHYGINVNRILAGPFFMKIFDFRNPMTLPLPELKEIDLIGNDEEIVTWIDNETLQMKGFQIEYEYEYNDKGWMSVKSVKETPTERTVSIR